MLPGTIQTFKVFFINLYFTLMKKTILFGWAILFLIAIAFGCKKHKDNGCGEAALKVSTTPANNTVDPPAPGPDFPLVVTVTDGMPTSGITIEVKAQKDSTNATPFFTQKTSNVTSGSTNLTITGTPPGAACIVNVTVTSNTCNTNQWTGSYRYSSK
jgi:hypothetical protein